MKAHVAPNQPDRRIHPDSRPVTEQEISETERTHRLAYPAPVREQGQVKTGKGYLDFMLRADGDQSAVGLADPVNAEPPHRSVASDEQSAVEGYAVFIQRPHVGERDRSGKIRRVGKRQVLTGYGPHRKYRAPVERGTAEQWAGHATLELTVETRLRIQDIIPRVVRHKPGQTAFAPGPKAVDFRTASQELGQFVA